MTHYPNVDLPQLEAKIFYRMWSELAQLGRLPSVGHVFCPLCLKPAAQTDLTLEHIIPQRALRHDPRHLREAHQISHRSGLTLLCQECNGLKGRCYDPMIEKMFKAPRFAPRPDEQKRELKARRTLAYLAAFRELGYSYILTSKLDPIRRDFIYPFGPPTSTGLYYISAAFYREFPHQYFDGWCDTFDKESKERIHSVFTCNSDPTSDYLQIRARHITVWLPTGDSKILLVRTRGKPPNQAVNMSVT
jgi:hypothetical protein